MELNDVVKDVEAAGSAIKSDVSDAVLHHRVSNRLMLLIVLLLVLMGGMYIHQVKKDAAKDALIQQMVQDNKKDKEETFKQLREDADKRVELAKQQKVIEHTVEVRDKTADKAKAEVTAPDRTVDQTTKDVKDYLNMNVKFIPDGSLFGFTQPDTQKIITFKIDRDRFEQNAKDTYHDLELERQKAALLDKDKQKLQGQVDNDAGVIQQLNKEKNPSKFGEVIKLGGCAIVGAGIYAIFHPKH